MSAINTLAAPVANYSFNILNLITVDNKRMDGKARKLLTCNRIYHPKSDVDRLYVFISEGGSGLVQLKQLSYKITTIGLQRYPETTEDWMMIYVREHEKNKKLYSVIKEAKKFKWNFKWLKKGK